MNEPIISPYVFYLIDILNSISAFCNVIIIICLCCGLALLVVLLIDEFENTKAFSLLKKFLIIFGVSATLAIVIPSKETCYQMLVASQVTSANIQKAGDTIDKSLDKISGFIVNTADKINKKGAD